MIDYNPKTIKLDYDDNLYLVIVFTEYTNKLFKLVKSLNSSHMVSYQSSINIAKTQLYNILYIYHFKYMQRYLNDMTDNYLNNLVDLTASININYNYDCFKPNTPVEIAEEQLNTIYEITYE